MFTLNMRKKQKAETEKVKLFHLVNHLWNILTSLRLADAVTIYYNIPHKHTTPLWWLKVVTEGSDKGSSYYSSLLNVPDIAKITLKHPDIYIGYIHIKSVYY